MKCPKCGHTPTDAERQFEIETLQRILKRTMALTQKLGGEVQIEQMINSMNKIIEEIKLMKESISLPQ